jgi:hypothetical protein
MSLVVVDRNQQRERLDSILEAFREVSNSEISKEKDFEKKANAFLDWILNAKNFLKTQSDKINELLPKTEDITSFIPINEELLPEIEALIDAMDNLASSSIRTYARYNRDFTSNGIDKTELKAYKQSVDDLKELATDLREIFFILPQDEEFQKLNQQLNDL